MYHIFFIHLSISEYLCCFHDLAIVSSSTMNIRGACAFVNYIFFSGCMPRSRIAGSYGSSIFSFLRVYFLISEMRIKN